MRLLRRGEPVAADLRNDATLRAAYDQHAGELYALAQRSLDDAGLAEEAVQETFTRAWRAADHFDPAVGSLRTWLFSICRNTIIDLVRVRASRPRLAGGDRPDLPDVSDDLDVLLVGLEVEEALRRLSTPHREVLVEVHLRDRPIADVAAELHVPVGTVYSRVFYALQALRAALDEMGVTG